MSTFTELNLGPALLEGLKRQNIASPTPIQSLAIPEILKGADVIAQSHTGSGKTLAFLLPLFSKIDESLRQTQVLVLAPTHELAVQIAAQAKMLAQNSELPITHALIMGGASLDNQIKKLREKPHIVIGSAGRILELIKKKKITAHTIKTIVLDEADSLLDNTNSETVQDIVKSTLRDRQLCLFSASISDTTRELAKGLMKEPVTLTNDEGGEMNPNITHLYLQGERRDKFELLRKLIAAEEPKRALIFVNHNASMNEIAGKLEFHKRDLYIMRGNTKKSERQEAMEAFRSGKVKLLVSSDLTARGLDVPEISHVIHLDLPASPQEYLHRSGRTARGTAHGKSVAIIDQKQMSTLKKYQKAFGIDILQASLSHGELQVLAPVPKGPATKKTPVESKKPAAPKKLGAKKSRVFKK